MHTGIDLAGIIACLTALLVLFAMLAVYMMYLMAMERPESFAKLVASIKAALPGKRD